MPIVLSLEYLIENQSDVVVWDHLWLLLLPVLVEDGFALPLAFLSRTARIGVLAYDHGELLLTFLFAQFLLSLLLLDFLQVLFVSGVVVGVLQYITSEAVIPAELVLLIMRQVQMEFLGVQRRVFHHASNNLYNDITAASCRALDCDSRLSR